MLKINEHRSIIKIMRINFTNKYITNNTYNSLRNILLLGKRYRLLGKRNKWYSDVYLSYIFKNAIQEDTYKYNSFKKIFYKD